MVCNTEEVPYSLMGRVITGRSTPAYDLRQRGQPYVRPEQMAMNHEMAPPSTTIRRYGQPLTEEERRQRHYATFGDTNVPPRGTGLGNPGVARELTTDDFLAGLVVGFMVGAFILTGIGRKILGAGGERAARYVKGR
jgi:hypothetical protein